MNENMRIAAFLHRPIFGELKPRDPARIDMMLAKIKEAWEKDPDLRLGQLILNCRNPDLGDNAYKALYSTEDDELLAQLTKVYKLEN